MIALVKKARSLRMQVKQQSCQLLRVLLHSHLHTLSKTRQKRLFMVEGPVSHQRRLGMEAPETQIA